jgi:hypothetical protein
VVDDCFFLILSCRSRDIAVMALFSLAIACDVSR